VDVPSATSTRIADNGIGERADLARAETGDILTIVPTGGLAMAANAEAQIRPADATASDSLAAASAIPQTERRIRLPRLLTQWITAWRRLAAFRTLS
jgi:hypothetical protein